MRQSLRIIRTGMLAIVAAVAVGAILLLLLGLFIYQIGYRPLPSEKLDVSVAPWATPENMEPAGDTIRILSLNLNYGGGETPLDVEHGDFKVLPPEVVAASLDKAAELARQRKADLLVLQGVSFSSRFAADLDQADYLSQKLRYAYVVRARTWKHPYLPFPDPLGGPMLGAVDTGLAIVSRLPIATASRFSLSQERLDNWWQSTFAPNYCLLSAEVSAGGKRILVFNTLLTSGDQLTRESQAREVALAIGRESNGAGVLAGTLHAPPKDIRLVGQSQLDYTLDLVRHRMNFAPLFQDREALDAPEKFATFFAPDAPPVLADYVLPEKGARIRSWEVLRPDEAISPHLPLLVELVL